MVGLLLVLVGNPARVVGATPAEKCAGAKAKAFGAAVLATAKCHAKARQKGGAVDADCLSKATAKLRKRFGKAEKAGTCPGDAEAAQAAASACVTTFADATTGDPACAARKLKAAGKKAAGKSACAKKAARMGTAVDPACLAKVEGKFAKAVAKGDGKGTCAGTAAEVEALVDACLATVASPLPCDGGTGFPTCDGTCSPGLACRPYEVFEHGASAETGCSCVDVVGGPECGGPSCSLDRHCADPTHVCERWLDGDPLGCDHMICQPAVTTPTTLPPDDKVDECDGGEFPSCGGTCANGGRCQPIQALYAEFTFFAGCACVDPRNPRCEMPSDCNLDLVPFSHCADPTKVCLVTLVGTDGDNVSCAEAHCGDPMPVVLPPTTVTSTSTSTSSTTTTSTSTSTTTTIPCASTPGTSGCFTDPGDCTIVDGCTGLQWEQKLATGGLHYVDDRHPWAGRCNGNPDFLCQPDAAAVATCMALAEGDTYGCGECATGTCVVDVDGVPATTAWEWINQLNAEGFAGHIDWRLPREAGLSPTGDRELESILLAPFPCGTSPCIDPIFGPTAGASYWSATTTSNPDDAWFVFFGDGGWGNDGKRNANRVRAVRDAP